jgi:hypothetical protein
MGVEWLGNQFGQGKQGGFPVCLRRGDVHGDKASPHRPADACLVMHASPVGKDCPEVVFRRGDGSRGSRFHVYVCMYVFVMCETPKG